MSASERLQHLEQRKQTENLSFEERLELEDEILELKYETGQKDRPSGENSQYVCIGCGS